MKYVIIGSGIAAISAAKEIDKISRNSNITIIGKEPILPYKRYLLTEFFCNNIKDLELFYNTENLFNSKRNRVSLRKGEFIKSIDTRNMTVKFHHNEIMKYDKLLIATGGVPVLNHNLKKYSQYITRYYSYRDILTIKKKINEIKHVVVSGEGLSILDLLNALIKQKKQITYIINGSKTDFHLLDKNINEELHELLSAKDIRIIGNDKIERIEKQDGKFTVSTFKEIEIKCDMICAWDQYRPNIDFINGTDIEKQYGILIDQYFQTNIDNIYAAGDCVEIYHPVLKDYWINFGWPNALKQGFLAGKNMAGEEKEYNIKDTLTFNLDGRPLKARWWD